jgi:hypothetical protein
VAWLVSHGVPTRGKIVKLFERAVIVDRVMQAGDDRTAAVGHLLAEELPCSVFAVMRDVGDGLIFFKDGLREVSVRVR